MAVSSFGSSAGRSTANDFVVNMNNTSNNTAILATPKPAGTYDIFIGTKLYDIYLIASTGEAVGYSSGTSITATAEFDTVVVLGASSKEVVAFAYSGVYGPSTNATAAGQETGAGPYITNITPTNLFSVNDTTTVTGGNFATNVEAYFININDTSSLAAKNIVRSSASQLIVTRPDELVAGESYKLEVTNPGVTNPSGSEANISAKNITLIAPPPSGGTITEFDGYIYHTFTSSGNFIVYEDTSVDYLVVAGGGGGGSTWASASGGGGGAGGLLNGTVILNPGTHPITVGAGGVNTYSSGTSGSNSSLGSTFVAIGGGRGASSQSATALSGGSGGGGAQYPGGTGAAGTAGQGFAGGNSSGNTGGGGGGAAEAGNTDGTGFGGDGLQLLSYAIGSGINVDGGYFAGGGRGTTNTTNTVGLGNGANNTGGGGNGGAGGSYSNGSNGYSGVVIVRYAK